MSPPTTTILLMVLAGLLVVVFAGWALASVLTWHKATRIDPEQTREAIDPEEYKGTWYEVAKIPQWFEKGCTEVTATYLPDGDHLRVLNSCRRADGRWRVGSGTAYPTGRDGVLAVSFFPGLYGNYTVVKRKPHLSIVSNTDKTSLWILARSPTLPATEWNEIYQWLRDKGYAVDRLVR